MRKYLYEKSPREAASEYLESSRFQSQNYHNKPLNLINSPSRSKMNQYISKTNSNFKKLQLNQENVTSSLKLNNEIQINSDLMNKSHNDYFMNASSRTSQLKQSLVAESNVNNVNLNNLEVEKERALDSTSNGKYSSSTKNLDYEIDRKASSGLNAPSIQVQQISEIAECTFAPKINNIKPRRNLDQFLDDQKQYQDKAETKKRILKTQMTQLQLKEEGSYQPEICQKSRQMLGDKSKAKGLVYERLYNASKDRKKRMENVDQRAILSVNGRLEETSRFVDPRTDENLLIIKNKESIGKTRDGFTPNIDKKSKSIKRYQRVDSILYDDAIRRQNKQREISHQRNNSSCITMSSVSKQALAVRFIKEFDQGILEFLESPKVPKLSYIQVNEFLKKLCFLKDSENINHPRCIIERNLLYDMWFILKCDQYDGVHRRNLLVFLLSVLNLYFPITKIQDSDCAENDKAVTAKDGREDEDKASFCSPVTHTFNPISPEGQPHREKKRIGKFDLNENWEISEQDVESIHKLYEPWYINRLSSGDKFKQSKNRKVYEDHTFHPEINESSKVKAQLFREKILANAADLIQQNKMPAPKDSRMSHADLLIASKKIAEDKINKFGELLDEDQVRNCTFQPLIKQPINGLRNTPGIDRASDLYSMSKLNVFKKDKNRDEVELERNYNEYTFQPNLGRRNTEYERPSSSRTLGRGATKSVERIRNARIEQELKASYFERGYKIGNEENFIFSLDKKLAQNPQHVKTTRIDSGRYQALAAQNYYDSQTNLEKGESNIEISIV